jgi:hypothetical protein
VASGDDYLFDKHQFAFVDFPQAVRKKILALQKSSQQSAGTVGADAITSAAAQRWALGR